jgi:hypothetical protein
MMADASKMQDDKEKRRLGTKHLEALISANQTQSNRDVLLGMTQDTDKLLGLVEAALHELNESVRDGGASGGEAGVVGMDVQGSGDDDGGGVGLMTKGVYGLSYVGKVTLLSLLARECYNTATFAAVMEENAEERANRITEMRKAIREETIKKKEKINDPKKKKLAIAKCREINRLEAQKKANVQADREEKAARKAEAARLREETQKGQKTNKSKGKGAGNKRDATAASIDPAAAAAAVDDDAAPTASVSKATAAASSTTNKGGKKTAANLVVKEPSASQVAAMLDDMHLLDIIGCDYTVDAPPDDIGSGEGKDSVDDDDEALALEFMDSRAARKAYLESGGAQEKTRKRNVARDRLYAADLLRQALVTTSERDAKLALKQGRKAGLMDTDDEGKWYCTELYKAVAKMLEDIKESDRKALKEREHEKALEEIFVRGLPLGQDRHMRYYWAFDGDSRIFVESVAVKPTVGGGRGRGKGSPRGGRSTSPRGGSSGTAVDVTKESAAVQKLMDTAPSRMQSSWSVYSSETEQYHLWRALDERGEREKALKSTIKAHYNITPPDLEYHSTGHEWIGREVRRTFNIARGQKKTVVGAITGWLPADNDDPAIWHVTHVDGDEEDLEEHEVRQHLIDGEEEAALEAAAEAAAEAKKEEEARVAAIAAAAAVAAAAKVAAAEAGTDKDGRRSARVGALVEEEAEMALDAQQQALHEFQQQQALQQAQLLELQQAGSIEERKAPQVPNAIKTYQNRARGKDWAMGPEDVSVAVLRKEIEAMGKVCTCTSPMTCTVYFTHVCTFP